VSNPDESKITVLGVHRIHRSLSMSLWPTGSASSWTSAISETRT
jgi:hypothetical protein